MSPVSEPILKPAVPGADASVEFPLQDAAVYGPIHSRRLGCSLGINPLPVTYKFCDFDCVYCQYGWTPSKGTGERIKSVTALLAEIREAFEHHRKIGTPVQCLTIAGNGEPTIYPEFEHFVTGLCALRDSFFPGVKIGILSDSSQIYRPAIRKALLMLDERYMKLDAGTPELVDQINKPRGNFNFRAMVAELKTLPDIVIQSIFIQGTHDNTAPEAIAAWIQTMAEIRPREVQVYTLDRRPADSGLKKVAAARLEEIARACEAATKIPTIVYN